MKQEQPNTESMLTFNNKSYSVACKVTQACNLVCYIACIIVQSFLIRKPKLLLVNNGRPCYQKSKAETFIYTQVKDLNHTLQIFGLRGACFFPKHGECSSFNFLLEHLQVQG